MPSLALFAPLWLQSNEEYRVPSRAGRRVVGRTGKLQGAIGRVEAGCGGCSVAGPGLVLGVCLLLFSSLMSLGV